MVFRSLLGVKKSTNLSALYCELGRKPLIVFRKIRILKYWSKIIHTDNDLLKGIYSMLFNDTNNNITYNGNNWAFQVKSLLDNLGFSYVWNKQDILGNIPFTEIKQRIIDTVNQDLFMSINTSTKLQSYCIFKVDTEYESYLNFVCPNKCKYALSKFRLSSHNLAIETDRYYGIPREQRLCVCCNMRTIENEFHFLLVCPSYSDIRRKYLPPYFCNWPTINKFKSLMQNTNKQYIKRLSQFIYFANVRRSALI